MSYFRSQKLKFISPVDNTPAQIISAIVVSVVIVTSLLVAALVTVLVVIKCLIKRKREQHEVYEMHNDGKPAETKYEVL